MSIFLKAKHWQLFLVLLGAMFLSQSVAFNSIVSKDSINPFLLMLPTFLFGFLLFGWLWAIATACSKAMPSELYSSPKLMQYGLIYALVYVAYFGVVFGSPEQPPAYIFIPHLIAMAAVFYALGFTAKQLTKLEQAKNVKFLAYSGPFFLMWFFPIGVWFVQPKVNELLTQNNA